MFKKPGFPEKGDFVICTVNEVRQYAIRMDLDEYDHKQGMLYTSEITRRLVRTLKIFFKVGRKVICKVMDVDPEKGHINLSHRRVGAGQERNKQKDWKKEKRADDLLKQLAKLNKLDIKKLHKEIALKLINKYGAVFPVFLEVARGDESYLSIIDKKIATKLIALIKQRILIPKAVIRGTLVMSSEASDGVDVVKKAVDKAYDVSKKAKCELEIKYIGAPKYKLMLSCTEFKEAQKALDSVVAAVEKVIGKAGKVEFKKA